MRVLIADDDRELAAALAAQVEELGHEVAGVITGGGLAVIQTFARYDADVILLDILMPRFNGLTASHAIRSRHPEMPIIFMSGHVGSSHPLLNNCGAVAYLEKPVNMPKLRAALDSAVIAEAA